MLQLIHPARPGQGRRPRRCALTTEEHAHLSMTIRFLGRGHGGLKRLARDAGVPKSTLAGAAKVRRGWGSAGLALAVAKAVGAKVEDVLSGKLIPPPCPTCGAAFRGRPEGRPA